VAGRSAASPTPVPRGGEGGDRHWVERGQHGQLAADESNLDHLAHRAHGGERVLAGGRRAAPTVVPPVPTALRTCHWSERMRISAASVDGAIRSDGPKRQPTTQRGEFVDHGCKLTEERAEADPARSWEWVFGRKGSERALVGHRRPEEIDVEGAVTGQATSRRRR